MTITDYEIYVEKPGPNGNSFIGTASDVHMATDTARRMAPKLGLPIIVSGICDSGSRREVRFNPTGRTDRLWQNNK